MYRRALDGQEKALGPDHTSTLGTVNNLDRLYRNQGRLQEAEAITDQGHRSRFVGLRSIGKNLFKKK